MENKNDEIIMVLKKQIEEKKKLLKASERFVPFTNCSLELDGVRNNIQVLNKEQLVSILVRLNVLKNSAEQLGLLEDYMIGGFSVEDWMHDVKTKMTILNRKQEEDKLKALENRLELMLSSEKKIELELEAMRKLLE